MEKPRITVAVRTVPPPSPAALAGEIDELCAGSVRRRLEEISLTPQQRAYVLENLIHTLGAEG